MKSVSSNKRAREKFQPITDDREFTNNNPDAAGDDETDSLRRRGGDDNEPNDQVCDDEGNNNRVLSNQQINELSSSDPRIKPSAVDDNHERNSAIRDIMVANDRQSEDFVLENNNNNYPSPKDECSNGSLQNRARQSSESGYDTLDCGTTYILERQNGEIRCPGFGSNGPVRSGCTPRSVSGCLGSDILGENAEIRDESGYLHSHHVNSNERGFRTLNKIESIKVAQEDNKSLPDYLKTLAEGRQVCGDTYVEFSKPIWFDKEKFERGQRFAMDHIFGVMFAELISLMILFAFRGGLEPLIFTGKSDTPFKAFKRYLSTVARVKSWYEGDIWDEDSEAHKNLKAVRGMHEAVRKSMQGGQPHEVAKRITLEGEESERRPLWTDLHEEILDDFRSSCPFSKTPATSQKDVFINQCDMGVTQFGFLGLVLVFPKKFGVHFATEEDFEGLSHFWRTIGYLLGADDRYNLCDGDLQTVRQRCTDIIEHWAKPAFRDVSRDWIHMSRCLFKGISFYVMNVKFEVLLVYLCNVLDIKTVKLSASFTLWQNFLYHLIEHLFRFTFRLLPLLRLFNWFLNLAVKIALHFSPKHMMRLEAIKYPYEISSEIYSTKL